MTPQPHQRPAARQPEPDASEGPKGPGTPPAKADDGHWHDAPEHDAKYFGEDELADEWGDESFPASDPPAHY